MNLKGTRIHPEKITHPFQLMAAWFVMLVLLVGILLTGAVKVKQPSWAAGFLVVSSVVLSILVMTAVFLMLTKYRPHLQPAKEYADWLSNERRHRGEKVGSVVIHRDISQVVMDNKYETSNIASKINDKDFTIELLKQHIQISNTERTRKVLAMLTEVGFRAEVNRYTNYESTHFHEAIWIGYKVPPRTAILAIKTVLPVWSHLKFMHLSIDDNLDPPDYVHDEIYIGGSSKTAHKYGLKIWTNEEINSLPDDMNEADFHKLIRSKYRLQESQSKLEAETT